jgi:hypothetical protein
MNAKTKKTKEENVTENVTPKKAKYEPSDLKRWLGHIRYQASDGTWFILVANQVQDAWLCVKELPDYPFHTLKDKALDTYILNISTTDLQKARQESR